MFQYQGIWLPDGEKHFPEWMSKNGELVNGKGTYQIKKFREAMRHVKQFRTAVDVGAHVGLWSMHMIEKFSDLQAFEPIPQFRECFARNVFSGRPDVDPASGTFSYHHLHPCALGAREGPVKLALNPADTGDTHVVGLQDAGVPTIQSFMYELDSFRLVDVDFIKIDCEGFELAVLSGATKTLTEWHPCVIVEQKQHKMQKNFGTTGTPAVDYLQSLGAVVRREMGGDYIMSWDA